MQEVACSGGSTMALLVIRRKLDIFIWEYGGDLPKFTMCSLIRGQENDANALSRYVQGYPRAFTCLLRGRSIGKFSARLRLRRSGSFASASSGRNSESFWGDEKEWQALASDHCTNSVVL